MCIDTRPYVLSAKHLMEENKGDDNMKKPLIDLQDLLLYTVVKDKKSFVYKLAKKYNTSIKYIDSVMGDIKYIREACSSDGLRKLFSEIDEKEPPIELNLLGNLEYNAKDDTDNIAKILVNLICFRCVDKVIENSSNIDKFKKFIHEEFVDIDFEVKYEDISLDTLFSYVANDIVKLYEFFKQKFTPLVKKYKDIDSILDAYYWPNDEFDDVPYFREIDNEIRSYTKKYITSELSDKVLAFCLVKLYANIQSTKKGELMNNQKIKITPIGLYGLGLVDNNKGDDNMNKQKNVLVFNNTPRVINKITFMTESNTLMEEVKKIISSDKSVLDFNKIYPMPDFKEYDYNFTLYHILYKLASMGIEKHVKDYFPRRSVATNEYRYVDGIYLDTVRRLSREMKVAKKEAGFLEVTTKERIIANIRAITANLIGRGVELPKEYHDFKNFESEEFIKAIEDNADFYFNNLLKYGVVFKLSWYTFYWGEEKALSPMWLNSNTIKFYTRFSNVLPLLNELYKKIACMNINIEYKYIHLDLPSKAFKYNINYLGANEVTLDDNEKINIYNELTK